MVKLGQEIACVQQSAGAMADDVFDVFGKFGKGLVETVWDEQWIVAEAAVAAW
jgi:hypothetical protein